MIFRWNVCLRTWLRRQAFHLKIVSKTWLTFGNTRYFFRTLFRIIFKILSDNRKEDTLGAQHRDPLGPLEPSFCQCIGLSSFMMIMIRPSLGKTLAELNIDPKWCFSDQQRSATFHKTTTLQPVENRVLQETRDSKGLEDKSRVHSNVFWLTHWSLRLGLHSMITEMNSSLSQYLGQLQRKLKEATDSGDENTKKRIEIAIHYILIRIYTEFEKKRIVF